VLIFIGMDDAGADLTRPGGWGGQVVHPTRLRAVSCAIGAVAEWSLVQMWIAVAGKVRAIFGDADYVV
jgi:hypothetical protein